MTIETLGLLAAMVPLGYVVVKWAFGKNTEVENRRRAAAKLAATLSAYGLKKTPEFLIDYSVGDYSGMAAKIKNVADLFMSGEVHIVTEFDDVFRNILEAKLKSEEGRALLSAKLAEFAPAIAAVVK